MPSVPIAGEASTQPPVLKSHRLLPFGSTANSRRLRLPKYTVPSAPMAGDETVSVPKRKTQRSEPSGLMACRRPSQPVT